MQTPVASRATGRESWQSAERGLTQPYSTRVQGCRSPRGVRFHNPLPHGNTARRAHRRRYVYFEQPEKSDCYPYTDREISDTLSLLDAVSQHNNDDEERPGNLEAENAVENVEGCQTHDASEFATGA